MGRPNLTEVRSAEILDAFERCVAKYGLEGCPLERIAEEAGMKRSILRHYIGNRDDLIEALATRVVKKYLEYFQEFLDSVSDENRVDELLAFFFPEKPVETAESVLVVESLISAGPKYQKVQRKMRDYISTVVKMTADQFQLAYPKASSKRCWDVGYGVVSIWFNQESLSALDLPPTFLNAARYCTEKLMSTLAAEE